MLEPEVVVVEGDTVISAGSIVYDNGVARVSPDKGLLARAGSVIYVDGVETPVKENAYTVSEFARVAPGTELTLAHIAKDVDGTGDYVLEQTSPVEPFGPQDRVELNYKTVLNAASVEYQNAGDWNGVLLAIQAIAAVLWAIVLAGFRNRRLGYSLSLLIGAVGFISVYFIHNHYALGVSYALMGCAWAAILAMPFTILTNALSGSHIGTYLGLFNCTICIPQIIAALCGGLILHCFPAAANGAPQTVCMLVVSGVLLAVASLAVWNIKETFGSRESAS